ncbi:MAG TPA: NUDIX domain-containing protein [Candidatus Baltobacteraceae bacterium]|nr:NUDIX domain-containing protein [Candidatus Baltobacteraceae bacterium]
MANEEDEVVDIFDRDMNPLGVASRRVAHEYALWHKSFDCFVVSSANGGQVLLQRRGSKKTLYPNLLDATSSGHYTSGEGSEAAVREIEEELGVKVAFEDLVSLGIRLDLSRHHTSFADIFMLRRDTGLIDYSPSVAEIDGIVAVGIKEGLELLSGKVSEIRVRSTELDGKTGKWVEKDIAITKMDFIYYVDNYFYKVFVAAERFIEGRKMLPI